MAGLVHYLDENGIDHIPVTEATPLPVTGGGGGGGGTVDQGAAGSEAWPVTGPLTDTQLRANPVFVQLNRGMFSEIPITLVANVAQTILPVDTNAIGCRVVNWTTEPLALTSAGGTPSLGAGSDCVPPLTNGVPGAWESPYAPINGIRVLGAASGGVTVIEW